MMYMWVDEFGEVELYLLGSGNCVHTYNACTHLIVPAIHSIQKRRGLVKPRGVYVSSMIQQKVDNTHMPVVGCLMEWSPVCNGTEHS